MHDIMKPLDAPRTALRLAFGLVPLLAGLDKFTYFLTDWSQYVAPVARAVLPVTPEQFLYVAGVIEVCRRAGDPDPLDRHRQLRGGGLADAHRRQPHPGRVLRHRRARPGHGGGGGDPRAPDRRFTTRR